MMASMLSLPEGYRALVIGASGSIGQAFVQALRADPRCSDVQAIRRGEPTEWDLADQASLEALALQVQGPLHLVVDASGALTIDGHGPEKRLQELDANRLLQTALAQFLVQQGSARPEVRELYLDGLFGSGL